MYAIDFDSFWILQKGKVLERFRQFCELLLLCWNRRLAPFLVLRFSGTFGWWCLEWRAGVSERAQRSWITWSRRQRDLAGGYHSKVIGNSLFLIPCLSTIGKEWDLEGLPLGSTQLRCLLWYCTLKQSDADGFPTELSDVELCLFCKNGMMSGVNRCCSCVENERNVLISRGKFSCFERTFLKREGIQTSFWKDPELASKIGKCHPQHQLNNTTSQPLKLREPIPHVHLDQNSESSSPPFRTRLN